jgi:hypothetical protein
VLAPGDPSTAVHDLIAVGLVRKTTLGMTETVTDVEWSEKKIWYRYRTNMVSGPPCCCILGYGAEMSVEDLGGGKTRLINKSYQEDKTCMPCTPCCGCLWWAKFNTNFLIMDVDALVKKYQAMTAAEKSML